MQHTDTWHARGVSSLVRAWEILACFDLAFAQPTFLSSRKVRAATCIKFWPFVGGIEGWSGAKFWASTSKGFWGGVSQFRKSVGFSFFAPSPYLSHLWTLTHRFLASCSPARGLSKGVKICGPKFVSYEKVGFSVFAPISRFRSEMHAFFHRVMPQISSVWR